MPVLAETVQETDIDASGVVLVINKQPGDKPIKQTEKLNFGEDKTKEKNKKGENIPEVNENLLTIENFLNNDDENIINYNIPIKQSENFNYEIPEKEKEYNIKDKNLDEYLNDEFYGNELKADEEIRNKYVDLNDTGETLKKCFK